MNVVDEQLVNLTLYRLEALYKEALEEAEGKLIAYYNAKLDALQDVRTWIEKFKKI